MKELKDSIKEAIDTLKSRGIPSHSFCVADRPRNVHTYDQYHFPLPPLSPAPVEKRYDLPVNSYPSPVMPTSYSPSLSHCTYLSTDNYVPPLPPSINITSTKFSPVESSHDEDSIVELTSSDAIKYSC